MNRSSRFADPASPEVRALAAAMRVALGSALVVACGGRLAPELEGPMVVPSAALDSPRATPTAAPTAAPATAPTSAPASESLKSCEALLAAAFPDGGAPFFVNDTPPTTDPALVACCDRIAAAAAPGDRTEIIRASGCCHVDFAENGAACTPWGPPVPPSMPARLA